MQSRRPMRSPQARTRSAFTLIELLVVIAIIAILAAILFPVFAKAREKARQSSCQSNQKQIGIAVMQYVQDYDETYPRVWMRGAPYDTDNNRIWWPDRIYPYIKNAQVFRCPSNSSNTTTANVPPGYTLQVPVCHYGMNVMPNDNTYWTVTTSGLAANRKGFNGYVAMAEVEDPSGTIFAVDLQGNSTTIGMSNPELWQEVHLDYPNNSACRVYDAHSEGFNALWGDGHVKWVRFGASKAKQWTIQDD